MRWAVRSAFLLLLVPATAPASPPGSAAATYWAAVTAPPKQVLEPPLNGPVVAARFAPNSKTLLTAGGGSVSRWETASGRHLDTTPVKLKEGDYFPTHPGGAVFAPDASRLAAVVRDDRIGVFDAATGADRHAVGLGDLRPYTDPKVAFAADGKKLLATFTTRENNLTGFATVVAEPGSDDPPAEKVFAGGPRMRSSSSSAGTISPDGSKVIVALVSRVGRAYRCELVVFGATDGKVLTQAGFPYGNFAMGLSAAPDGRSVLVTGPDDRLVLCDAATGRPRLALDVMPLGYVPPAFAPDGRTVAVVTGISEYGRTAVKDYRIRVLETATGGVRFELNPAGYVNCLAVAPDGGTVAAGLSSKLAVTWDVSPETGPRWWDRTPTPPAKLWDAVRSGTAARAWPAIRELAARPEVAVRLVREKLPPAPPAVKPDAAGVAKLIASWTPGRSPTGRRPRRRWPGSARGWPASCGRRCGRRGPGRCGSGSKRCSGGSTGRRSRPGRRPGRWRCWSGSPTRPRRTYWPRTPPGPGTRRWRPRRRRRWGGSAVSARRAAADPPGRGERSA